MGVEGVVCLLEGGIFVNIDVTTKILSKVAMDASLGAEKACFRIIISFFLYNLRDKRVLLTKGERENKV